MVMTRATSPQPRQSTASRARPVDLMGTRTLPRRVSCAKPGCIPTRKERRQSQRARAAWPGDTTAIQAKPTAFHAAQGGTQKTLLHAVQLYASTASLANIGQRAAQDPQACADRATQAALQTIRVLMSASCVMRERAPKHPRQCQKAPVAAAT